MFIHLADDEVDSLLHDGLQLLLVVGYDVIGRGSAREHGSGRQRGRHQLTALRGHLPGQSADEIDERMSIRVGMACVIQISGEIACRHIGAF